MKTVARCGLDRRGYWRGGFKLRGIMALSDVLAQIVGFLRAGYPEGVPVGDYIPLVALLRRRLTDDEVIAVATERVKQRLTAVGWPVSDSSGSSE
jgi:hypothetical protein